MFKKNESTPAVPKGIRINSNRSEKTATKAKKTSPTRSDVNRALGGSVDRTSSVYIENYKLVDDQVVSKYADLAVEALFNHETRKELEAILRKEFRHISVSNLEAIMSEIIGLGKFEDLIMDETVTDLGFNGNKLWIETNNGKEIYDDLGIDEQYINRIVQRFANYAHKEFSEKAPLLNAQLGNIRISATHRSVSIAGTSMSMRHARARLVLHKDNFNHLADPAVYDLLKSFVESGSNILIDGVVGTAKTELTKLLIGFIPDRDKIIMIEDTPETHIKTIYPDKDVLNWILLDSMTPSDLIAQAKRNNPVHVILTEARDHAVFEIHQSVKAGFKIMLSIHSEDAKSVPSVMIDLMKQKYRVDEDRMFDEIKKYYDIGVHMEKRVLADGRMIRFISEIVEYTDDGLHTLFERRLDESRGNIFTDTFPHDISDKKKTLMSERRVSTGWSDVVGTEKEVKERGS